MIEKQNEFGCTLIIDTEEENPRIVTDLTGILSSECLIKGENKVKFKSKDAIPGQFNLYNLWILKVDNRQFPKGYLNSSIELMLDLLDDKKDEMLGVLKRFPKNHLVCHGYFYEVNPYFLFDKKLIERLNYYHIDVEFDIYCLPSIGDLG
ncbi:DUF4279 domain-containing protein [Pedobacter sp.]|uniref:DUF4279 domain-containing protein n=1 Tax=Pedobacter sp. TaxID=1411316 RepID=UPI0031D0A3D0